MLGGELFGCFSGEGSSSEQQTSPVELEDASGGVHEGPKEVQVHEGMQEEACSGERNLVDKEFSPDISERLFKYKSVKGMLSNVPIRGKYLDTQPYVILKAQLAGKDSLVVSSLLSVKKTQKATNGSKARKGKKRNHKKFEGTERVLSGDDFTSKRLKTCDITSGPRVSDDDSYLSDPHLEPSSDSSASDREDNWNRRNGQYYDSESSEENNKYVIIYPPESPEPQNSKIEVSPVDEVKEQVSSGSSESQGYVGDSHLVEQRITKLKSECETNAGSPMEVDMSEAMEGDRDEGKSSPGGSSDGLKQALDKVYKEGESMSIQAESHDVQEEKRSCFFLSGEGKVSVKRIEALESTCVHEVAVPPNTVFEPLKSAERKPAKAYSFLLDPFQKEAILCIENNQSVLVSAHTSAGKTVVAEYSIALALGRKQRVIYTTPIKALSNQKYREFGEEFIDVGLITGDVTINPTASCLIMTTEILRNMLYHGSEVMREVSWVIFDEIHYMRDKERGVVWEETLILLPDNVHYVFLSATIPNARQFAEWVCFIHRQPCHVVYTEYRPTPLQHYIYPTGSDGIHLVVNENGEFLEGNFDAAMKLLENETGRDGGNKKCQGVSGGRGNQVPCFKLIKMVMERNLSPAIIFSFSKKDCEHYAMQTAKLDLITKEEKLLVDEVFQNAMRALSEDDKTLPQVKNVLPLLRRGIGIHHGGLLPILKETIEVLFSEGLIKALFATETFAMGLNMPAKTVLFTSSRKFDGHGHRYITSGEYIQMSGRAGRRGLDDKGTVILMVDEKLTPSFGRSLLQGKADPLNSAFHLTNHMILNLLRVDSINPEYMMERSFLQFQNVATMPELEKKLKHFMGELVSIEIPKKKWVQEFHENKKLLNTYEASLHKLAFKPRRLLPFLTPGRLVKVRSDESGFSCWGILVKQLPTNPRKEEPDLLFDVLLPSDSELSLTEKEKELKSKIVDMDVQTVPFVNLQAVSQIRLNEINNIRLKHNRLKLAEIIKGIGNQFYQKIPELDPIEDLGAKSPLVSQLICDISSLRKKVNLPCYKTEEFLYSHRQYMAKLKLMKEIDGVNNEIKRANSLLQIKELKCRKRILRRLGFCSEIDVIKLKGRVACELSNTEGLVLTELLFSNLFGTLSAQHAVALLSIFVCDERCSNSFHVVEELTAGLRMLKDTANLVFKAYEEANLGLDRDEFLARFKPAMTNVVFAWAKGEPFYKICQMTDIFEGSIIRCLRRLEELLRQLIQATKVMGNVNLENLFTEGIRLIKRDIVFAASLYL